MKEDELKNYIHNKYFGGFSYKRTNTNKLLECVFEIVKELTQIDPDEYKVCQGCGALRLKFKKCLYCQ